MFSVASTVGDSSPMQQNLSDGYCVTVCDCSLFCAYLHER